jgi:hypothetical protein
MAARSLKDLERLFKLAGAPEPESWAEAEHEGGSPQLHRYLFLRQAWRLVVKDGDTSWLAAEMASSDKNPQQPGAGYGTALHRLLAAGADPRDISDVARHAQWQLLHGICYLLSDPDLREKEFEDVAWALFEVDASGEPARGIEALHESVLDTDPTGREMRPRPVA